MSITSLSVEVLQLVLNHLDGDGAGALSQTNKHFHSITKQDYVRAQYLRERYENPLAQALGRALTTTHVLDIIIHCHAPNMSRYMVQCAAQHYFCPRSEKWIKTSWTKTLSFPVFSHFLQKAAERFGNIDFTKGMDDGSKFQLFLHESRISEDRRTITWEEIAVMITDYKFIPFSPNDPITTLYPLVLAVEPRLLECAETLGFTLDSKYRDFIFRKILEKPDVYFETRCEEMIQNVEALQRLDPRMFLSRTVAAEVCMEAHTNTAGWKALKKLHKTGKQLLFDLPILVNEVIQLFATSRSITGVATGEALKVLYKDFPSEDSTTRLVLLLSVFLQNFVGSSVGVASRMARNLEDLDLLPLDLEDIGNLLRHPMIDEAIKVIRVLDYAKLEEEYKRKELTKLAEEVAIDCLELASKGRTLAALVERFPSIHQKIADHILKSCRITVDDLPSLDNEVALQAYKAPLGRDYLTESRKPRGRATNQPVQPGASEQLENEGDEAEQEEDMEADVEEAVDLGEISQNTLSTMITLDQAPSGRRSRWVRHYSWQDERNAIPFPDSTTSVVNWARKQYGSKSDVSGICNLHALLNGNSELLSPSNTGYPSYTLATNEVPLTFQHFELLAHLGKINHGVFWNLMGTPCPPFHLTFDDYCTSPEPLKSKTPVKMGSALLAAIKKASSEIPVKQESKVASGSNVKLEPKSSPRRGTKRPRRSEAAISYYVPDSDDEDIVEDGDEWVIEPKPEKKYKAESQRTKWLRALEGLLEVESAKYKAKKKMLEKEAGHRVKLAKNDFLKSLTSNLHTLRRMDEQTRRSDDEEDSGDERSDGDWSDDDYVQGPAAKRRKLAQ